MLIYPKLHVECRDSVIAWQINVGNSKAALWLNLGIECRNWCYQKLDAWGILKQSQLLVKVQGHATLIFLPQFRTYVSLFEYVIRLVPAKLRNFTKAIMLYDKCFKNKLWSYPYKTADQKNICPGESQGDPVSSLFKSGRCDLYLQFQLTIIKVISYYSQKVAQILMKFGSHMHLSRGFSSLFKSRFYDTLSSNYANELLGGYV